MRCNLCSATEFKLIYPSTLPAALPEGKSEGRQGNPSGEFACTNDHHGEYYPVVRCVACGLVFCSPRAPHSELCEEYSSVVDTKYKEQLSGRVRTFERNLRNLERHHPPGRLLDIGCAMGVFLQTAKKGGWKVRGVEPSAWCVQEAQRMFQFSKDEITQGTSDSVTEIATQNGLFDVVTFWDVLEHVDDPMQLLKNAHQALKPGGVLAFSTVDIGSLYARLMGKRWPWLMKMHIYYFDRKTIREYLRKTGFSLLEIKTYRHTVSYDYLLYKLKAISPVLYTLGSIFQKVFLLNKNIFVPVALGDFMEVYAKKV